MEADEYRLLLFVTNKFLDHSPEIDQTSLRWIVWFPKNRPEKYDFF